MSASRLVLNTLKTMVMERRGDVGVPLGFEIPESMKDPRILAAEQAARRIQTTVLQEMMELIEEEPS
jgi:hypothetical protein